MLLPIAQIQDIDEHYAFKTSYDSALKYQLNKILHLTKEVENHLDKQFSDPHWYIRDKTFSYNLDNLINNLSTLTEYYHCWVIFSHIGTIKYGKAKYVPLKNDGKIDSELKKIFEAHSIGVLENYNGDNDAYLNACRETFMHAYDFLFVGKFHELYVLNNYLKHNMITLDYAPKMIVCGEKISVPYIYIERPCDRLLNSSVFKCLLDHELDQDGKVTEATNNYYAEIINSTTRNLCKMGGYDVYNINGIDYLKGSSSVGICVESIVEIAHDLVSNIVKIVMGSSKTDESWRQELSSVVNKINARSPKTLNKLIIP